VSASSSKRKTTPAWLPDVLDLGGKRLFVVLVGAALIPYVDRGNLTATRPSERKTAVILFTMFCALGLILTFVGIFFRGPGYTFVIPYVTAPGMYFSL